MTKGRPDSNIAKLAARAGGVFSHQQARDCGFTPRQIAQRVGAGIWTRVLPGVYRHTATPASTSAMSHAALLWAGSPQCRRLASHARHVARCDAQLAGNAVRADCRPRERGVTIGQ
jgi:Transcriptional regulator, AbiEi antitoxin